MDFLKVIANVTGQMDAEGLRYALIGGFAMAMRGVQRATIDMDFIVLLKDLEKAHTIFTASGYRRVFNSTNVSHYISDDMELGRIDILHAFRGPTLSMLERADRIEVEPGASLPVVQIEDIIGLKIQALVNDPTRRTGDWHDIRLILETAFENGTQVDWELIQSYLDVFKLGCELKKLHKWYGQANEN